MIYLRSKVGFVKFVPVNAHQHKSARVSHFNEACPGRQAKHVANLISRRFGGIRDIQFIRFVCKAVAAFASFTK